MLKSRVLGAAQPSSRSYAHNARMNISVEKDGTANLAERPTLSKNVLRAREAPSIGRCTKLWPPRVAQHVFPGGKSFYYFG